MRSLALTRPHKVHKVSARSLRSAGLLCPRCWRGRSVGQCVARHWQRHTSRRLFAVPRSPPRRVGTALAKARYAFLARRSRRSVSICVVPVARPLVKARASKRLRRPCFSSCYALGVAHSCSLFKISRRIPRALLVPAPRRRGRFRPRPQLGLCSQGVTAATQPAHASSCVLGRPRR